VVGESGVAERRYEEAGNPPGRRPRAAEDDALVADGLPGHPQRRVHPREHDCGGALDIVVERAQPISKTRELSDRVGLQKVFPL
jgi:hypothetical protein